MLTLEVNDRFVTWPERFAEYMMHHYRTDGVSFVVHRDCVHARSIAAAKGCSATRKKVQVGAFEYACGYR